MSRVLITGGAGFIGSHLCKRFLEMEYQVFCLDNLITGSLSNIEDLFQDERFTFIKMDITNYVHIPGELHYILHFASPASPVDYLQLPIQTLKVGALGTHKALGLAKAKGAKFLLASTSEVYGDPTMHPQNENYWGNVNPIGPRGVYDEAKRFAEALVVAYHKYHNLKISIARIFNTFGPRMRINDGRAIPTFISQAIQGKDLTIFGDGAQTRSFCYIDDMIEGLISLLMSDYSMPVNIGNPAEMNLLKLAEAIIKLTGSDSKMVFRPLPEDDPKVRQPDISRAKKLLGWEPVVSLDEGLKRTIEYFKKEIGRGD